MALGDASSGCACPRPHDVYLELVSRKDLWFAKGSESEEEVARGKIDFHLVLNSVSLGQTVADGSLRLQRRWVAFRVQCCNFGPSSPPLLSPTCPSNSTTSLPNLSSALSNSQQPSPSSGKFKGPLTKLPAYLLEKSTKPSKKVAFSTGSSTSVATLAKTSISSFTSLEPTKLVNICEITLGNKGKKQASPSDQDHCHGCIVAIGQGRKFALYPPREQNDSNLKTQQQSLAEALDFRTTFTLRQILDSDQQGRYRVPKPSFADKIRMAVAISASVLHMDSTPWLSKPLTLDDIVFLVDKGSTASERFKLRAFISKPVHSSATSSEAHVAKMMHHDGTGNPTLTPSPLYPTTFYLGLLLCQLMLKDDRISPIETGIDLKAHQVPIPPGAAVMPDSIHQRLVRNAKGLADENQEAAGADYKDVVQWCLETYNSEKGLDDEHFRKLFYAEVVEKLRDKYQPKVHDL
ncbi:hypothetical protein QBC45DRAFT_355838 [Copromyces sp. CBS 386.78]|nr:hypothetical protein QBC45DRAFT_355838 [Copromyces sp. CBS 386.78]